MSVKAEYGLCSAVADIDKLEKLKKSSLESKLAKLNRVLKENGAKSKEFYNFIKPFIMYALHKSVPYQAFCEDMVNETFMKVVIAFEGGWQEKGKKRTKSYKEAYYDPNKCKNVGNFIYTIARNEATRFLSAQKKYSLNDDITEHVERANYSKDEYARFVEVKPGITQLPFRFKHFEFNNNFKNHLDSLQLNKPANNVLYNLILWEGEN